jgi:hypothetical protein
MIVCIVKCIVYNGFLNDQANFDFPFIICQLMLYINLIRKNTGLLILFFYFFIILLFIIIFYLFITLWQTKNLIPKKLKYLKPINITKLKPILATLEPIIIKSPNKLEEVDMASSIK